MSHYNLSGIVAIKYFNWTQEIAHIKRPFSKRLYGIRLNISRGCGVNSQSITTQIHCRACRSICSALICLIHYLVGHVSAKTTNSIFDHRSPLTLLQQNERHVLQVLLKYEIKNEIGLKTPECKLVGITSIC